MTMQPPDPAAVNPPAPTTPASTGASGSLPDETVAKAIAEAEEWKKRFAGLQQKYQTEQTKWAEASAKLLEYDEQSKKLSGDLEATKMEYTKAVEERDTYQTDLDIKAAELERLSIITREFPHLLPLMGEKPEEDSLPDGTGDELRARLKVMSEKIDSLKKGAVKENVSGASPSVPPPSIKGGEALLHQAITAMRAGKMEEYNNLYAQYIESTKQNP